MILPVQVFFHLPEKKPHKLLSFEVHIADHCNLNCVGCAHFSPLAEPAFADIEIFKRDFIRMGELFADKCTSVFLLGGEPLLNPEINKFMEIARENFPSDKTKIYIVTNGILLLKQNEDFWRTCHDKNIIISMTHYPIKLDIEGIKASAKKFEVKFQYHNSADVDKTMHKIPIDLTGKGNAPRNFLKCGDGNGCIFLGNGKLYTCVFMPNIRFFNKAFNQNIPVTEADYIDIYSDITPDEIFRRLATHVPACSYCNMDAFQSGLEWRVSKREMSEWV